MRVLIASGVALERARAAALLGGSPDLLVVGMARQVEETLRQVTALVPDVVLLGVGLLSAPPSLLLRRIAAAGKVRVILLAEGGADPAVLSALEAGAAEFFTLTAAASDEPVAGSVSLADLVRQVGRAPALAAAVRPKRLPTGPPVRRAAGSEGWLIAIGASAGGPQAVQHLLEALPGTLDAAVVVALHLPASFTRLYAERLGPACRLRVREAVGTPRLLPGDAWILTGGTQGQVERRGDRLHLSVRPRLAGELRAPSVDLLLRSAAAATGARSCGVVLTGMGEDGAEGLSALRAAGGFTIAESQQTALVFGMPQAAIRRGGASVVLPLGEIAAALLGRCGERSSSAR